MSNPYTEWTGLLSPVELDTFANESDVMWRGFVASAIAAVALQYVDPFGTAKLVLFQVTSSTLDNTWRAFELVSAEPSCLIVPEQFYRYLGLDWVSLEYVFFDFFGPKSEEIHVQGVVGSLLIKLNVQIAVYRRNSILHDWPILEVVGVSAITAAICYLVLIFPSTYLLSTRNTAKHISRSSSPGTKTCVTTCISSSCG